MDKEIIKHPGWLTPFMVILLCIFVFVAAGCVSAYYFNKAHDEEKQGIEDQIDRMEGQVKDLSWKTYTDPTYGFSFKYPREWVVGVKDLNDTTNWVVTLKTSDYSRSERAVVQAGEQLKIFVNKPSLHTWPEIISAGFGTECQSIVKNDNKATIGGEQAWIMEGYGKKDCEINPGIVQSWGRISILTKANVYMAIDYSAKDRTTITNLDKILNSFAF